MNREFNLKYNRMKGSDVGNTQGQDSDEDVQSVIDGTSRNICFVVSETYRVFLNYAFLVSGEFISEQNIIRLQFTSHQVELTGVNLEHLFYKLMDHGVRQIIATDSRYNILDEKDTVIVNDIRVNKSEN